MNYFFYKSLTDTETIALLIGCKALATRLVTNGINNRNQPLTPDEITALSWYGRLFWAGKLTEPARKAARLEVGEMAALAYRLALELASNPVVYEAVVGKSGNNPILNQSPASSNRAISTVQTS